MILDGTRFLSECRGAGQMRDIPWREIRGFRNQAVHAYFSIDWSIVREVATTNLPELHDRAIVLLRAEFPDVAAAFDAD